MFGFNLSDAEVLIAALIVVAAGLFTLRNNMKSFWKDLAEERGEQVRQLERHLREKTDELLQAQLKHSEQMAAFAEEQREVRHELKNELASTAAKLVAEQAKHDLSSVLARIDTMEEMLIGKDLFHQMLTHMDTQAGLLVEMRDQLKTIHAVEKDRRTP